MDDCIDVTVKRRKEAKDDDIVGLRGIEKSRGERRDLCSTHSTANNRDIIRLTRPIQILASLFQQWPMPISNFNVSSFFSQKIRCDIVRVCVCVCVCVLLFLTFLLPAAPFPTGGKSSILFPIMSTAEPLNS